MNNSITNFNNGNRYNFNSSSGSGTGYLEEEEEKNKLAGYIALVFLIFLASIIVCCFLVAICDILCCMNSHSSNFISTSITINNSYENQNSNNNNINDIRNMGKKTLTKKVSNYFEKIINPIYNENIDNCAICLEKIDPFDKDDEPSTLKCNHTYHKRCISEFVLFNAVNRNNINCPLCRDNIYIV